MYYIGSKWILLLHVLLVLSIAISSLIVGHEIGYERYQDKHAAVTEYAIMLEKENAYLNKKIRMCNQ